MALIQVNYLSMALFRTVPVNVILPVDKFNFDGTPAPDARPYKTLYLLHGLLGNYTDWVTGTRIQRWAEERDLAVVMPSGDNAFYIDRPAAKNCYGEFVGRELVEMTRRMFPLSDRREDTFIAGLSMGGYGAIRNGLKYSDTFGCVAGLSSALHMFDENDDPPIMDYDALGMGPLEKTRDSDMNPRVLIERLEKSKKPLPKIYLACGTEDGLLESNRAYRDLFRDAGFDLTYYEGPGGHEWDFWDDQIRRVLDWLPLKDAGQGVNSGNVGLDER